MKIFKLRNVFSAILEIELDTVQEFRLSPERVSCETDRVREEKKERKRKIERERIEGECEVEKVINSEVKPEPIG